MIVFSYKKTKFDIIKAVSYGIACSSDDGVVIAASKWGKVKTVFQMIMVGFMIGNLPIFDILTQILMWIALALTVISLVDYIAKNVDILKDLEGKNK